jgi:hypothetical protein
MRWVKLPDRHSRSHTHQAVGVIFAANATETATPKRGPSGKNGPQDDGRGNSNNNSDCNTQERSFG